MKTITIQIGNSDNKLTQSEWAHYVESTKICIENTVNQVHFFGGAPNWYPWQNVAWVCIIFDECIDDLTKKLIGIRKSFNQDSIAVTIGDTEFI